MPVQYTVCLLNDIPMTWRQNAKITFWMTIASVFRTYVLRRLFNAIPVWWRQFRCSHRYEFVDIYAGMIVQECHHCGHRVCDIYHWTE